MYQIKITVMLAEDVSGMDAAELGCAISNEIYDTYRHCVKDTDYEVEEAE